MTKTDFLLVSLPVTKQQFNSDSVVQFIHSGMFITTLHVMLALKLKISQLCFKLRLIEVEKLVKYTMKVKCDKVHRKLLQN